MSNTQPIPEREPRTASPADQFAQQSGHWREIGITAVAAAARYSSDAKPATPAEPNKIVTLRDIEHFAA